MKRPRTSSSPLQESPPINKKIILIESPSSSSSMKDPTINTVSPPPAKIHHSDQLHPNHFVRLIPDSSSFTSNSVPFTSSSENINKVNSLASNSPVSCFNSKSSLTFKRPLPFKRRCNSVPLITTLENNEININNFNSLASNSQVSFFNSKSSLPFKRPLPFKRQRNSVPLTTSENISLTELAEHHNPPHPQPAPHPQPQPDPNPHPDPDLNPHPILDEDPVLDEDPDLPLPFHPPPLAPHPVPPAFPPLDPLDPDDPHNVPPPAVWRICCIGATRIGIVTMMMIANFCPNVDISIVDEDDDVINMATQGVFPFYEPQLQQLNNHLNGFNPRRLRYTLDIEQSILDAHIIFIGIGIKTKTKPPAKKGQVECTEWMKVWKHLVRVQNILDKIIVDLTTLPLDFERIFRRAIGHNINNYRLILNPSFISEGRAINDIHNPSMVVLAYTNLAAAHALFNIYTQWVPLQSMHPMRNLHSAVVAKLGLNLILATRVISINTLNHISEEWGAERTQFSRIITRDYRIEEEYFDPGIGFGGPNLEKSLYYLSEAAHQKGQTDESRLCKQLVKSNETARKRFVKEMQVDIGGTVGEIIAVLGFSYKKDTSTFENSPVIRICLELVKEEGAILRIFDPRVPAAVTRRFFNNNRQKIQVMEDVYDACNGADAICILTDWDQFLGLDFAQIYGGMRRQPYARIFFGRHMNIPQPVLEQIGFRVHGIL